MATQTDVGPADAAPGIGFTTLAVYPGQVAELERFGNDGVTLPA